MPNSSIKKLVGKNYISFIERLPGSAMWQHLFVIDEHGNEKDVINKGELACAYMVSSVLTIFQAIDKPHATVATTVRQMQEAGWQETKNPTVGSVVVWKDHIGFYLAQDHVISTSSESAVVKRHAVTLDDGRIPLAYYTYKDLEIQNT